MIDLRRIWRLPIRESSLSVFILLPQTRFSVFVFFLSLELRFGSSDLIFTTVLRTFKDVFVFVFFENFFLRRFLSFTFSVLFSIFLFYNERQTIFCACVLLRPCECIRAAAGLVGRGCSDPHDASDDSLSLGFL